ncbi:hypothetical protein DFH06DRAFT_100833 [Mycena polygramma]|nr:hypothetical protein DFH06DRAFT_100833 [Mycena polygramma]
MNHVPASPTAFSAPKRFMAPTIASRAKSMSPRTVERSHKAGELSATTPTPATTATTSPALLPVSPAATVGHSIFARICDLDQKITDAKDRMLKLRNKDLVQELQCTLRSLQHERTTLLMTYFPSISVFPNEVLTQVFVHFLLVYPECPPLTGPFSPLTLTHVCRHWRAVAIEDSRLWRAISFHCYREAYRENFLYLARIWLHRSRARPLSVKFSSEDDFEPIPPPFIVHHARWEYADIGYCSEFPELQTPMPLLRATILDVDEHAHLPHDKIPALRSIRLYRWVRDLPWTQLVYLQLARCDDMQLAVVLSEAPNLRWLQVELDCLGAEFEKEMTHESLERLVLTKWFWSHQVLPSPSYLQTLAFRLPALRWLEVPLEFVGGNPAASVESFISTTLCCPDNVLISGTSAEFLNRFNFTMISPTATERRTRKSWAWDALNPSA